jgi:hypothetical protein
MDKARRRVINRDTAGNMMRRYRKIIDILHLEANYIYMLVNATTLSTWLMSSSKGWNARPPEVKKPKRGITKQLSHCAHILDQNRYSGTGTLFLAVSKGNCIHESSVPPVYSWTNS